MLDLVLPSLATYIEYAHAKFLNVKSLFPLVTCNSLLEKIYWISLDFLEVKFNKCFQGGKYKLQGGTLIYIEKFIIALFDKMDSRREVKFTSSAWKLTSSAWKWYYSFCREIFSFGEFFGSKHFFKNCGPYCIRGPN